MAKTNQAGLIERHIEKIVLAVCALILIVAMVGWVLYSPHNAEISGQVVHPRGIDSALNEAARQTAQVIERTEPQPLQAPRWVAVLARQQEGLAPENVPPTLAWVPPSPAITPTSTLGENTLSGLTVPENLLGKPLVRAAAPLVAVDAGAYDVYSAHVAAVLDYRTLVTTWQRELREVTVPLQMIFLDVSTERQELLADGSWGEAQSVSTARVRQTTGQWSAGMPEMPQYNGNVDEVLNQLQSFAQAGVQRAIVQPEFYRVRWVTGQFATWRHLLPVTPLSQWPEAEVPFEHQPPVVQQVAVEPVTPQPRQPAPRAPTGGGAFGPGAGGRGGAAGPGMGGPGMGGPGMGGPGMGGPGMGAPGMGGPGMGGPGMGGPGMGGPGMGDPGMGGPGMGGPGMGGPGMGAPQPVRPASNIKLPEVTPVPALGTQFVKGQVLVWQHDVTADPDTTYRYRVVVKLLNPLFGQESKVDPSNASLAEQVAVSLTSPWSEPVTIPPDTRYFVVSGRNEQVSTMVFRRAFGRWHSSQFSVRQGEPIGGERQVSYLDPATGQVTRGDVDFRTGVILVDHDFDRRLIGTGGVESEVTEAVLLDAGGALVHRIDRLDSRSEEYRELTRLVREAEAELRQRHQTGMN